MPTTGPFPGGIHTGQHNVEPARLLTKEMLPVLKLGRLLQSALWVAWSTSVGTVLTLQRSTIFLDSFKMSLTSIAYRIWWIVSVVQWMSMAQSHWR